jgi:methylated-DNA-[protein]-cysteine S-methyltransferase
MAKQVKVSEYQTRVYTLLQQIPEGRITTYAALSKALQSSPRAVGGALRNSECPDRSFDEGGSLTFMVLKIHSRQRFRVIDALQVPVCVLRSSSGSVQLADTLQFIGGFKGDWEKVPSGQNQESKLKLLMDEGVHFDANGMLIDKSLWFDDFDVNKMCAGGQSL